jgi:Ca-activated chloride channel homolog
MNPLARCAIFMLAVLFPLAATAQERPRRVAPHDEQRASATVRDSEAGDDDPLTLEASVVEVPVVVADRSGRYVPGLRECDFALFENGEPQRITYFRSDRVPIHVALLLDTSSSTRDSLEDIRQAAVYFLPELHPDDRVMVLTFDGELHVEQEFTNDRDRLEKAIRHAKTRQGTKLYDAVVFAVAERLRAVSGRKAIVLLSDGDDTRSDASFDEALGVSTESDVAVYGIRYPHSGSRNVLGFPVPGGKKKHHGLGFPRLPGLPKIPGVNWPLVSSWTGRGHGDFMEAVTQSTGGRLFEAQTIGDMGALFNAVAEELRHVYVLGYSPSNPISKGGFRSISVRIPSDPDLVVRHRMGYGADSLKRSSPSTAP